MKEFYYILRKPTKNKFSEVYLVENNKVTRLYINEETKNSSVQVHLTEEIESKLEIYKSENLLDAIYNRDKLHSKYKDLKKYSEQVLSKKSPGIFHNRIYRPLIKKHDEVFSMHRDGSLEKKIMVASGNYEYYIPRDNETMINSVNQLSILTTELNYIFQTINASPQNYNSFGHKMRNLLILASTEVEAQLKGILRLHIRSSKTRFTTKDYIKLLPILQLDQYKLELNYYPNLKPICPFKKWNKSYPTKSLKWYNDYNAIKHDREMEFHRATLLNTINAVSAIAVLILAQYGPNLIYWKERISNFYNILEEPQWDLKEYYIPPFKDKEWKNTKINL